MALVTFSPLVSNVRGSISGISFGNSRSGATIFKKPSQLKKHTSSQCSWLSQFHYISSYWDKTVSSSDKLLWFACAKEFPYQNRLGETRFYTAKQLFIKINCLRFLSGQTITTSVPNTSAFAFTLIPDLSKIIFTASNNRITVSSGAFSGFSETVTTNKILIYCSNFYNYTSNLNSNFFKYIGYFSAAGGGGGFNPTYLTLPFNLSSGYYISTKFVHFNSVRQYSNPQFFQKQISA